jgi:simple sugar transport system ATP-binding protein
MDIELNAITKFFTENRVLALDGAGITLKAGEIHAILGENGAGKSTLTQILAGFLTQDSGEILVDGIRRRFRSPRDALAAGIGMVRQRPLLTPGLRVWEACVLGAEAGARGHSLFSLYRGGARRRAFELNGKWGFALPMDRPSENLSAAQRQLAAVLALLLRGTNFLIFDEPTAVLGGADSERLFALWRNLAEDGRGVALISHKLEETLALSDTFTVLRRGKTLLAGKAAAYCEQEIIDVMFGKKTDGTEEAPERARDRSGIRERSGRIGADSPVFAGGARKNAPKITKSEVVLAVNGLSVNDSEFPALRGLSFELRAGEILGIAGVKESGTETLELALAGFLPRHISGSVMLCGAETAGAGPRFFREKGGAYLGAGRKGIGGGRFIVSQDERLSLRENVLIHAHRRLLARNLAGRLKFFDIRRVRAFVRAVLENADIHRAASSPLGTLSGGMSQRLLGIREFAEKPRLIVFAEPAWGLDRARRRRFFEYLRREAAAGRAVLLFFAGIDDIVTIAERVLVLRGGEIVRSLDGMTSGADEDTLIKQIKAEMTGGAEART